MDDGTHGADRKLQDNHDNALVVVLAHWNAKIVNRENNSETTLAVKVADIQTGDEVISYEFAIDADGNVTDPMTLDQLKNLATNLEDAHDVWVEAVSVENQTPTSSERLRVRTQRPMQFYLPMVFRR